jgi:hypothetical protein
MSVSAPVTRMDKKKINDFIPFLREMGIKASGELGWGSGTPDL